MAEGYEDIDRLTTQKQSLLDNALKQQNDIVDKQTQMSVNSLERQKTDIDKEATQQNKALYQDYKKATNPFGEQAENLASQGLANSGYAETTKSRLYNTYQQNITSTLNSARELKSDVDFQIQQAIQSGDITKGQNALELYKQKLQLLSEEYDLRNNREQFLYQKQQDALAQRNWQQEFNYQKSRDKVSDSQWNKNFNYQKSRDKVSDNQWNKTFKYNKSRDKVSDKQWSKTFNYQKSRDKVSDKQWNTTFNYQKSQDALAQRNWEKEYELSKKARASSSRSSSGYRRSYSTKKSSSGTTSDNSIRIDDGNKNIKSSVPTKKDGSEYTAKEVLSSIKILQGPELENAVHDSISGKTFKSIDAVLNYYGYAGVND